jgi:hypothetical protein
MSSPIASATEAFSGNPLGTWSEPSPRVRDGAGLPLWDRVELHEDGDGALFAAQSWEPSRAWADDALASPHLASLFGTATPPSGRFLLHFAPGWSFAERPVPVLLVPGAGLSASAAFGPLARSLAGDGYAVFAISFAHPDGDCFGEAEVVVDAIDRIGALLGASAVDVVGHSKGGVVAAIAAAHGSGVSWPGTRGDAYASAGTPAAGRIRKLVLVGAPLAGLDTPFRWTNVHLATGAGSAPAVPSAWTDYYPFTTGSPLISTDLSAVDLWDEGGDAFVGQAQLLARWDDAMPLPGSRAELGGLALQQDWWTTYEGGYGVYSASPGIDDAIGESSLIAALQDRGVDASVQLAALAGTNPLIPVDPTLLAAQPWSSPEMLAEAWRAEFEGPLADDFPDLLPSDAEYDAMGSGALFPGEVSGPSDGLVFVDSALALLGLTQRGASVLGTATRGVSHVDLVLASPSLGQALVDAAGNDPDRAWQADLGRRYIEADTMSLIAEWLADPAGDDDDSSPGDDDSAGDDDSGDDDTVEDDDDTAADDDDSTPATPFVEGCTCMSAPGRAASGPAFWLLLLTLQRRKRWTR